ncbi:unnamed protein product [Closterium sp. NIES-64]|nr:unnamed protein product [Closterium sp. NIES-65]CAI5999744.1 unnamed protein product [Closterium sp. NIES-64]
MADEVSLAEQEARLKKKYGGALPKKKGLLSKGHERAFFDSAEWAIQKQKGAKPAAPAEEGLQPKLEPTPHQPATGRRSGLAEN